MGGTIGIFAVDDCVLRFRDSAALQNWIQFATHNNPSAADTLHMVERSCFLGRICFYLILISGSYID